MRTISKSTDSPTCRWVPVVDGSGRRRLEMRWESPLSALLSTMETSTLARAA